VQEQDMKSITHSTIWMVFFILSFMLAAFICLFLALCLPLYILLYCNIYAYVKSDRPWMILIPCEMFHNILKMMLKICPSL